MVKRISMLSVSIGLTVVVFIVTTAVQRFFVNYEPTVRVLAADREIQANRPIDKYAVKTIDVPLSMVINLKVAKRLEDIQEHYAVEPIHRGEIIREEAIAMKNEVKIIEVEQGKEKVSVKIKAPENAVSYQLKTGDKVNLYFTGRYGIVSKICPNGTIQLQPGQAFNNDDYCIARLLENVPVQGIFDSNGSRLGDAQRDGKIDTMVFSVSHKDAGIINNLKSQGTFDVTGLPY